jgi:hypothetical protein
VVPGCPWVSLDVLNFGVFGCSWAYWGRPRVFLRCLCESLWVASACPQGVSLGSTCVPRPGVPELCLVLSSGVPWLSLLVSALSPVVPRCLRCSNRCPLAGPILSFRTQTSIPDNTSPICRQGGLTEVLVGTNINREMRQKKLVAIPEAQRTFEFFSAHMHRCF